MEIHKEKKTILGGVHLELTGEVNDDGYSVVCPPFLMLFVRGQKGLKINKKNRQSVLVVRWSWRTRTSRSITEPIATRV